MSLERGGQGPTEEPHGYERPNIKKLKLFILCMTTLGNINCTRDREQWQSFFQYMFTNLFIIPLLGFVWLLHNVSHLFSIISY